MILLGFLISLLLGNMLLRAVSRQNPLLPWEMNFALSLSAGLASSGLLTFLSLLIFGEFNRTLIIVLNLAALLILAVSVPRQTLNFKRESTSLPQFILNFLNIFLWLSLFLIISELALSHPYGQWDAWALWNMKTKFIIFGGKAWQNIFQLHWHTQPDYPLMLPMMNTWLTAVSGDELHRIAMATANVFTLATAYLLFAALKRTMPAWCALIAGLMLVTNRFYLFMGTSQYADIILAHYLLASGILITLGLREKNAAMLFLAGLFLGILGFIKNEGIIMALILLGALVFPVGTDKSYGISGRKIFWGFCATAWAAAVFKLFLSPANRDISLGSMGMLPQLVSPERVLMVLEYLGRSAADNYWHYIWIAIVLLIILNFSRFRRPELKIFAVFFAVYLAIVGIVYLTTANFDLLWRLSRTAPRILFCLMPLALFLSLTAAWPEADGPLDDEENKGIIPGS